MLKGLFSSKKTYTSITVAIDNLTKESNPLDDLSGVPLLVELIGIQTTGPGEATTALRRKLKYGNGYVQVRALVFLDGLIQNAGSSFQHAVGKDAKLIAQLRICATSRMASPTLRNKCTEMFCAWGNYGDVEGLHELSNLYAEIPPRDEAQDEADRAARVAEAPRSEWQPDFAKAVDMHAALKPGHSSMFNKNKRLSRG